jgi:hypothetical protein
LKATIHEKCKEYVLQIKSNKESKDRILHKENGGQKQKNSAAV